MGKAQKAVIRENAYESGYSDAAHRVAKVFVTSTKLARKFDPSMSIDELMKETDLTEADVVDAVHELKGMVGIHSRGAYYPESELFATFDGFSMPWNPKDDALALATDMLNDNEFPSAPADIAASYGWEARRLNPAMAYLVNRKLVQSRTVLGQGDWLVYRIGRTDETRRFVKSRR